MTDQTESASEYAHAIAWLRGLPRQYMYSAEHVEEIIRALEAKVLWMEGDMRVLRRRDDKLVAEIYELRADRDRLAGEVERLTNMLDAENSRARRLADLNDHLVEKVTRRAFTEKAQDEVIDGLVSETRRMDAEVARLTSELAAAREDLAQRREHMRRGMQSGVNTARARGDG